MDLKIKDVADLLNVSETTIRRWLVDEKIPAYRINRQYRFSRIEIEDWVMSHKLGKNNDGISPFEDRITSTTGPEEEAKKAAIKGGNRQFSLYRALHKGAVLTDLPGDTKEDLIRSATKAIAGKLQLDAEVLTDLLLDRERLMPTALNNGIGVPHTRDFLLPASQDVITIVFPKKPIEYGSLDGQPVHTMFFLMASEDKRHLHLLAKIAHLSHQPDALRFFQTKPSKNDLLEYVKQWESGIPHGGI